MTVEVLSDSGGLKHTFVMLYIYIHILYRYCTVHIVYMYHVYTEMIIPQLLLISYSMYAYIYIYVFLGFVILIYPGPPCTLEAVFTENRIFLPYLKLTQSFENDVWKMTFLLG